MQQEKPNPTFTLRKKVFYNRRGAVPCRGKIQTKPSHGAERYFAIGEEQCHTAGKSKPNHHMEQKGILL
jgi:hypothetical protein